MINKNLMIPILDKILPWTLICLIIAIPTSSTFRAIFLILSVVFLTLGAMGLYKQFFKLK